MNGGNMSNETPHSNPLEDDEMAEEYDFSQKGVVRGKHAQAMRRGYTVIVHKVDGTTEKRTFTPAQGMVTLDPDVQSYFPDSEAVNRALRGLIDLIPKQ
jgi:hypothetical protein